MSLPENKVPKVRQSTPKQRRQVEVDALDDGGKGETYYLWKKEERYLFAKEKKDGYAAIFKVPDDKEVKYSKRGVPVIKTTGAADEDGEG